MYDDFVIHLEGLKLGVHTFKFLLDDTFFKSLEFSLIKGGEVKFEVELNRRERMMEMLLHGVGKVELDCDRCGELMHFPLDFEEKTVVKYGTEEFIDDGIWEIPAQTKELNVAHFFYETVCLQVPSKVTHEDAEDGEYCDEEVLKRLESLKQGEKNSNEIDPRWEALNKLK